MLPKSIENDFIAKISEITGTHIKINSTSGISGGSINQAVKANTDCGDFFIKWNSSERFPGMFAAEAKGLELLGNTNTILIPKVILQSSADEYDYLVLDYIKKGTLVNGFWHRFAKDLADLHSVHQDFFGLDHDNYIGSLKQFNNKRNNWVDFFIEQRLEVQLKQARDKGDIQNSDISSFNTLFKRLNEIFPDEPSSLIHGDLWNGNYLVAEGGIPCILDPAAYYGNREMDLAMSKLFGGFSSDFYEAYNEIYPLEKGWLKRIDICNLYPLLVHVNLFGLSYLYEVRSIIRRF